MESQCNQCNRLRQLSSQLFIVSFVNFDIHCKFFKLFSKLSFKILKSIKFCRKLNRILRVDHIICHNEMDIDICNIYIHIYS